MILSLFITEELSAQFIQNTAITGKYSLTGNTVKIGSAVSDVVSQGKVTISSADVDIECSSIEIYPETEIDGNSKINITIEK